MANSVARFKALILALLGEPDDGPVANNIDSIWDTYADKAYPNPRLQYQYALVMGIDVLLGATWSGEFLNLRGLKSTDVSDKKDELRAKRKDAQAEIEKLESQLKGASGGASSTLTQTAPIMKPDGMPFDANDSVYRGNPYYNPNVRRP